MTYCTQQHLIDRYGEAELIELTDRADLGVIDTVVIDAAITRASAKIDGYCRARYQLPLSVVDDLVIGIACDIARAYLYDDQIPEVVAGRHADALVALREIATGKIRLAAALVTSGSDGMPQFQPGTRVFSRDNLKGF